MDDEIFSSQSTTPKVLKRKKDNNYLREILNCIYNIKDDPMTANQSFNAFIASRAESLSLKTKSFLQLKFLQLFHET